jgi:hypothetical protein
MLAGTIDNAGIPLKYKNKLNIYQSKGSLAI